MGRRRLQVPVDPYLFRDPVAGPCGAGQILRRCIYLFIYLLMHTSAAPVGRSLPKKQDQSTVTFLRLLQLSLRSRCSKSHTLMRLVDVDFLKGKKQKEEEEGVELLYLSIYFGFVDDSVTGHSQLLSFQQEHVCVICYNALQN